MRRAVAPGWLALPAALLAAGTALAEDGPRFTDGATAFQTNCAVCHRANGAGTPGLAPPVTVFPPRFVEVPEGRRQLALTVLYGMYGDIVVAERRYNFKMPDFSRLDDDVLAATLNFVVFDLAHARTDVKPLSAAEIAAERAHVLDGSAVRDHRAEVVDKLAP